MRANLPPSNAFAKVLQKMQIRIYFWKKMYFCIKKVLFVKISLFHWFSVRWVMPQRYGVISWLSPPSIPPV